MNSTQACLHRSVFFIKHYCHPKGSYANGFLCDNCQKKNQNAYRYCCNKCDKYNICQNCFTVQDLKYENEASIEQKAEDLYQSLLCGEKEEIRLQEGLDEEELSAIPVQFRLNYKDPEAENKKNELIKYFEDNYDDVHLYQILESYPECRCYKLKSTKK